MFRFTALLSSVLSLATLLMVTGCTDSQSGVSQATIDQHRIRLVMNEEPEDGLQTVGDVRITLLSTIEDHVDQSTQDQTDDEHADGDEDADHDQEADAPNSHAGHKHDAGPIEVLMVGQIGGLTNPWEAMQPAYPFAKNQALLFVADPGAVAESEASGHVHAPGEECTFCESHAAETSEMLAMVRFHGKDGNVLPIEAQELFNVAERDTVIIKGTARLKGGMMVVDADGLYLRK